MILFLKKCSAQANAISQYCLNSSTIMLFFTMFMLMFQCNYLSATILKVPQNYSTVLSATNTAKAGDTILIGAGTYAPGILKEGVAYIGAGPEVTVFTELPQPKNNQVISNLTFDGQNGTDPGLYPQDGTSNIRIEKCVFRNGAYIYSGINITGIILNNTFYGSKTDGIRIHGCNQSLIIENNIIMNSAGSAIAILLGGNPKVAYNCSYGNGTNTLTGTHNIYSNPLLQNPAVNNFNLKATSPCINAGDPTLVGSMKDIGALKYNNPPGFISTPDTILTEDLLWTYDLLAVDVDAGDTVSYSLNKAPAGMTLSKNTVKWTPSNANVGVNAVIIRATDSRGAITDQSFRVRVTNVNDSPAIISTALTFAVQNQVYQYQAQATDPDVGDILTWQLILAPNGMSISSTGLISWTPAQSDIGSDSVVLQVRDIAGATARQQFAIIVANVNDAPVIKDTTGPGAVEDSEYSLQLKAVDPDGNQIFWFVVQAPESLKVELKSGTISWIPRKNVAGTTVNVKIRATDGLLSDTTTVSIFVTAINHPPMITTVLPQTFKTDTLYSIPLLATDLEGDSIAWTILRKPATMTIISNILVWSPNKVGNDTLTIIASDGKLFDTLFTAVQIVNQSLVESANQNIPKELSLAALPNPANSIISFQVGIPVSSSTAILRIYNIKGELIREWQTNDIGTHVIRWNGVDIHGRSVGNGIYVAKVNTKSKSITQRFNLLK